MAKLEIGDSLTDDITPNERVAELFKRSAETGEIVTREQIVEAAGSQLDPLKRVRRNGGARDILDQLSIEVVWLGRNRWKGQRVTRPAGQATDR